MKIAVLGAGAVGSLVGGLLARAGEDVTLIGRPAHVTAINRDGLRIDGALGELRVPVKASERLDFTPHFALLTVKTQALEATVREALPHLKNTVVVTFQNGTRADDMLAGLIEKERIVSCVVMFGAIYLEPGRVTYSTPGELIVGNPFRSAEYESPVRPVAALLNQAIPTTISNDIRGAHWTKLIINENNALPAITGLSIQQVNSQPALRRLSVHLMREATDTMRAAGVRMRSVPRVPAPLIEAVLHAPLPVATVLPRILARSFGRIPAPGSTLQSIQRGEKTEIDYLNGEIVALGKRAGVATPYNSVVVALVHRVEETGAFISPAELLAAVREAAAR